MSDDLGQLSASQLHEKIIQRHLSPAEVLEYFIQKTEIMNPRINAVTEKLYDRARRTAELLSTQLHEQKDFNPDSVFYGLPFSVKEMIAVQDALSTGGSWHRRESRSEETATVVQRLQNQQAIPFVTTNVPELGFWFETDNPVYGRTKNPYDPRKTSGGSSGGEAALIGSGGSIFGLGSDIGGSVRLPASFCGIFGHKPTHQSLPFTGHFPYRQEDFKNLRGAAYPWTTMGFLSRYAKDLPLIMDALKGPDGIDTETKKLDFLFAQKTKQNSVKGLQVYILPEPIIHGTSAASAEISQTVIHAAKALEELGADIIELPKKYFLNAKSLWMAAVKATKPDRKYEDLLVRADKKIHWTKEVWGQITGQSQYTIPSLVTVVLENMSEWTPEIEQKYQLQLQQLRSEFHHLLGPNSILIAPTYPKVAPAHRQAFLTPFDFIYSGIFTVLQNPATSVPMGLNKQGLPLGVQIISAPFRDDLNFYVADVLESIFGGWTPPTLNK
ncbi:MAG: amidase [Pseudobdellovibrionaceae bacterium]